MNSLPASRDTSDYYNVHLGIWTNWSRGKVFGSTITLKRTEGTLLIAFIAFFVSIVGTSFWRIACYLLHRIYSTEATRDALYHQRQAVLRNSANGTSGLGNFLAILWAWAKVDKAARRYIRICPLIAFTLFILLAFAAASGLSSRVSTAIGNEVLLSGSRCGIIDFSNGTSVDEAFDILNPWIAESAAFASIYKQQCYSNNTDTDSCHTYIKESLPVKTDGNASCPFDSSICQLNDQNLHIDSGLLDSNDHFGLNTPPSERIQFRNMYQCAPLNTTKYELSYNYTDDMGQYSYVSYSLGPRTPWNYTIAHPKMSRRWWTAGIWADYDLKVQLAYLENGTYENMDSSFIPIPELQVPHTDVILFSLGTNTVVFEEETTDPWYSARSYLATPYYDANGLQKPGVYYPEEAASIIGCASLWQWCNPNIHSDRSCTPLASFQDALDATPTITRNSRESDLLRWMAEIQTTKYAGMSTIVQILGIASLAARERMTDGLQGPLPTNQWQLEVEGWFSTLMAAYQQEYVGVATGPSDPKVPIDSTHRHGIGDRYCKAQKIRSSDYTNFSTFGLCIIFGAGGLVVILSYTVEPLTALFQRRRRLDQYSRLEWNTNEVLQLQRLAHEELGLGTWRGCDGGVPVTERPGECLAVLDIADPKHPRLKAPPGTLEELVAAEMFSMKPKEDSSTGPDTGSSRSQLEANAA